MPTWKQVSDEMAGAVSPIDGVRRKYLEVMHEYTGRNVIAYYSAFIQKPGISGMDINDSDKNAFMQVVHGLDSSKGLDLILHTPGGDIAATESLVYYLKKMFGDDIRVFIPQIAMSAGTMIALSSKEIVMGKHSNLGPIDPQYRGVSCAGVIEEFERAKAEVRKDPTSVALWSCIIGKYHPTFLGDCEKAVDWAKSLTQGWLASNMLKGGSNPVENAKSVVEQLSSHAVTYTHSRHIHIDDLRNNGVNVTELEGLDNSPKGGCDDLHDCVLTVHHAYMNTFAKTPAVKIVENHTGNAVITSQLL